jgi:hypothetical protein
VTDSHMAHVILPASPVAPFLGLRWPKDGAICISYSCVDKFMARSKGRDCERRKKIVVLQALEVMLTIGVLRRSGHHPRSTVNAISMLTRWKDYIFITNQCNYSQKVRVVLVIHSSNSESWQIKHTISDSSNIRY